MATNLGTINKSYVSLLDTDMDVRDINSPIVDAFKNKQFNSIVALDTRRNAVPQTQIYYKRAVNANLDYKFQVAGVTSGSGTGTIVVTTTDTDAVKRVRKGAPVYFTDGQEGLVQITPTNASGTVTVTIKTVNGNLTASTNDYLAVGGSVIGGEQSGRPDGIYTPFTTFTNRMAILTDAETITDVENYQKIRFTYKGQDSFMPMAFAQCYERFQNSMNQEMVFGKISTTSFSDASPALVDPNTSYGGGGGGQQTSNGLYHWIKLYGKTIKAIGSGSAGSEVPNGTIIGDDIANIVDTLLSARADTEQFVFGGVKSLSPFDEYFKNLGSSGVTSVRLVVDGKELDTTIDQVTVRGFQLNFTPLGILDNPTFASHPMYKSVAFVPKSKMVPVEGGGMAPALSMRYYKNVQKYGGKLSGNEYVTEFHDGGMSPVNPTGTTSNIVVKYQAGFSLDNACPHNQVLMQVI